MRGHVRQGLILAAGRGSRLQSSNGGGPKCLTRVGHQSLIRHLTDALKSLGVEQIAVVVGYLDHEVRSHFDDRGTFIRNSIWSSTNSLYSLGLASKWVQGPFVVANSDVLAHPTILEKLLQGPPDAFAYDSSSGDEAEHMKVSLDRGVLKSISKELPPAETHGENLGLLKFSLGTGRILFEEILRLLRTGKSNMWAPEVLNRVASRRHLHGVDVAGEPWIEIDYPSDLERARERVWPKINGHASIPVAADCAVAAT